jgi:hypothetical protein
LHYFQLRVAQLKMVQDLRKATSVLAPWAIVRSTIAHGVDFSEFQHRRAPLKLAN